MADTTSTIDAFLLRTKITNYVNDHTELRPREMVFGSYEKSLFVKSHTTNDLYMIPGLIDTTTNVYNTWSSDKISTYVSTSVGNLINDSTINLVNTWSSSKISTFVSGIIDDDITSTSYTWSSSNVYNVMTGLVGGIIDDDVTGLTTTWSSSEISSLFSALPVINDSTYTSSSLWSSEHTYDQIISITSSKIKQILFTAGGITPYATSGCGYPSDSASVDVPKLGSTFTSGQKGYFNIIIPGDYSSHILKITIVYSGPTSQAVWGIRARPVGDNESLTTGGSWSTQQTITDTPGASTAFQVATITGTYDLFGASSNINKFCPVELHLVSGTGTYTFYQLKFEYL